MNVGLKVALIERGLKQIELSRLLGCDPAKVSKIVNGWIDPDQEMKRKIARFVGRPVEKLFEDHGCGRR